MAGNESRRRPRPRLYRLHQWFGLAIAVVGTLVFFSGVLATFASEIDAWAVRERSYTAVDELAEFDVDRAIAVASAGVEPGSHQPLWIIQSPGGPLLVYFESRDAEPHAIGAALDPETLEVLVHRDGTPAEVQAHTPQGYLAHFVVELHVFLLLPRTLGLLVTGLVAFGLLALVISGVWVHQPTPAKLTRRPRGSRLRVLAGDLHTLVGSWTVPYTAVIAATGAFFCFSSTVVLPVLALARFGGDYPELIDTIVAEVPIEPGPGTSAIDPIVDDALERSDGASFRAIQLADWGEPSARATVMLVRESAWGDETLRYVYAGHDGSFLQEKPEVGAVPSLTSELLELIDELHFGTLLGVATQLLWALLGLATCALSATGLLIYSRRQTVTEPRASRVAGALAVALSGGLLASSVLVLASWSMACALGLQDPTRAMTLTLIMGLLVSAMLGWRWSLGRALSATLACTGVGLVAAPSLVAAANGLHIGDLWSRGPLTVSSFGDLLCVTAGIASLAGARALSRRARAQSSATPDGQTP
jgi:uncharacterized iron-regulated membrane protein